MNFLIRGDRLNPGQEVILAGPRAGNPCKSGYKNVKYLLTSRNSARRRLGGHAQIPTAGFGAVEGGVRAVESRFRPFA